MSEFILAKPITPPIITKGEIEEIRADVVIDPITLILSVAEVKFNVIIGDKLHYISLSGEDIADLSTISLASIQKLLPSKFNAQGDLL